MVVPVVVFPFVVLAHCWCSWFIACGWAERMECKTPHSTTGYYHYSTGTNASKTYEEVLPEVKKYHDSLGVPFGHWQFDSWFYPKVGACERVLPLILRLCRLTDCHSTYYFIMVYDMLDYISIFF